MVPIIYKVILVVLAVCYALDNTYAMQRLDSANQQLLVECLEEIAKYFDITFSLPTPDGNKGQMTINNCFKQAMYNLKRDKPENSENPEELGENREDLDDGVRYYNSFAQIWNWGGIDPKEVFCYNESLEEPSASIKTIMSNWFACSSGESLSTPHLVPNEKIRKQCLKDLEKVPDTTGNALNYLFFDINLNDFETENNPTIICMKDIAEYFNLEFSLPTPAGDKGEMTKIKCFEKGVYNLKKIKFVPSANPVVTRYGENYYNNFGYTWNEDSINTKEEFCKNQSEASSSHSISNEKIKKKCLEDLERVPATKLNALKYVFFEINSEDFENENEYGSKYMEDVIKNINFFDYLDPDDYCRGEMGDSDDEC